MAKSVVVIPALNPDLRLSSLVNELKKLDLKSIVIVDDGSTQKYYKGKASKIPHPIFPRKKKKQNIIQNLQT